MDFNQQFAKDVKKGLTSSPKRISSKYFYDERGSKLFQEIMDLDAYYLTRAERSILEKQGKDLVDCIHKEIPDYFQVVELGAGDARKTEILLQKIDQAGLRCTYRPADIDLSVLGQVEKRLRGKFKNIVVDPIHAYNQQVIDSLKNITSPLLLLFLGSNMGNYRKKESDQLLNAIGSQLKPGDLFMMGLDRKKDPRRIIQAYDDPEGVTQKFNLNLLHRINRELDADIPVKDFIFYPNYNVEKGEVRSYLIATKDMDIHINALNLKIHFKAWEYLHTEISRKYAYEDLQNFAQKGDLQLDQLWTDANEDFWLSLFKKS